MRADARLWQCNIRLTLGSFGMKVMSVYLDGSSNDRDSLTVAAMFCEKLGGRLNVIYASGQRAYVVHESIAIPEASAAGLTLAKQAFDAVCGGRPFARFLQVEAKPEDAIRDYGLLTDINILERVHGDAGPDVLALNTALFETPAPVLVCPPSPPATIGTSVAVVWSASIQSAKAVHSAMPLISTAERVTVLLNAANVDADPTHLMEYLSGYGVRPKIISFEGGSLTARGRGRAILAAASENKADFLVMGAYGDNMWSSLTGMGRTTQKVCTATKIPTLIQH
jgi:nucleotide-binding universal stress UspA family protein